MPHTKKIQNIIFSHYCSLEDVATFLSNFFKFSNSFEVTAQQFFVFDAFKFLIVNFILKNKNLFLQYVKTFLF